MAHKTGTSQLELIGESHKKHHNHQ